MNATLNAVERRVLGVLIEKALSQPQYYPMTLNAIVTGCNQKSNRDPLMDLDETVVWDALERMRAAGLVSRLMPGGASRVERFRQETRELLSWEKPQRAVMAELLLRGPQTPGELRGRCSRMYPFENLDSVQAVLDNLMQSQPPWVGTLPRATGQSVVRYAHQLYPDDEPAAPELGDAPPASSPAHAAPSSPGVLPAHAPSAARADAADLAAQVSELRQAVAALTQGIADLSRRVETLEGPGA